MKTVTLRSLLREPRRVKQITNSGTSVCVTERGEPLWIIKAAASDDDDARRRREWEKELAEVAKEPKSKISLSKIIIESRR